MNLTDNQKLALAKRIVDAYSDWVKDELEYQIELMKDNDEISYEYYDTRDAETEDIRNLVIDMLAVPVS